MLPSLAVGGAERQAALLARHLVQVEDADAAVLALGDPGPLARELDAAGVRWHNLPLGWPLDPRRLYRLLPRFALALRRARPEAVMPYTIRPNVLCGLAWRASGARVCIWNQRDEGRSLRVAPAYRQWSARLTPRFVSNSSHGARFLTEELRVAPERIRVIPNGVWLPEARTERDDWRRKIGLAEDTLAAVMVANLHGHKDHATLIAAWSEVDRELQRRSRRAVLLLAGRLDNASEPIRSQIGDLGLVDRVRLLGPVEDVAGLLAAADLAVFSSLWEGLPNGVLEAMAAGLPVVATDIPGAREALGDEAGEDLVAPRDPGSLAARIVALALDPGARIARGERNRRRVETVFSPRRMLESSVGWIADGLA